MSIVPWWYARLLTSLNAEPDTCTAAKRDVRTILLERTRRSGERGLILNPSTQMSCRSLTYAGTPSELRPVVTSSALERRSNSMRGTKTQ